MEIQLSLTEVQLICALVQSAFLKLCPRKSFHNEILESLLFERKAASIAYYIFQTINTNINLIG